MAMKIISEVREIRCTNCKVGLTYNTEDEKLSESKTHLIIVCPRCNHKVLTMKLSNFGID